MLKHEYAITMNKMANNKRIMKPAGIELCLAQFKLGMQAYLAKQIPGGYVGGDGGGGWLD